jgi:hypothetical protein
LALDAWYRVVTPRAEVRKGRSFSPDEFAIALEDVVAGTAEADYTDPKEFFARTVFTKALREQLSMVLGRLSGKTQNTAPVIALVTQFGGGKTHALTAMYHLIQNSRVATRDERVKALLKESGIAEIPKAKVAVFVGNAWDPQPGSETPWIFIAKQLAGQQGVDALGPDAKKTAPGTTAIKKLFDLAGGTVLILMDEVLNYVDRHRDAADSFRDFLDNLVRATTSGTRCVAVISLPRSKSEMTDFELEWQEKLTKLVRRVARELIVNEEGEIAEVVRRRLFDDLGPEKTRASVAKVFAEWCFERRNQLPPEWTIADSSTTDAKAKEQLQKRFERCYPFHPATLSVFQRKWQTLSQYQQTRGTLAMLAQWVSLAFREGFEFARDEPLLMLGSAPLDSPDFRSAVLGQLGEPRLVHAIDADIAGEINHAAALDEDTRGNLEGIHRRVACAILFESSGGMTEKAAHLPEIRFAVGEPGLDTTSIDNAAQALERKCFYLRPVGKDGFRFGFQPTLKKVVGDRRASLDENEIQRALKKIVKEEWEHNPAIPPLCFPESETEILDKPKLTIVVVDPQKSLDDDMRKMLKVWTETRGGARRLYPASIVWTVRKQGKELRDKVESFLAWKRVHDEISSGLLGEFEPAERQAAKEELSNAEGDARDEVWASYQFALLYDRSNESGLKLISLGAGHASSGDSLTSRVLEAMKAEGLLNESFGAGYLQRNWPTALKTSGIWPLSGIRQSFLDGSLTRLLDTEQVLTEQVIRFVQAGEFGLGTGHHSGGKFDRLWFAESIRPEDVTFDDQTFLVLKDKAQSIASPPELAPAVEGSAPERQPSPPTAQDQPGTLDTFVTLRASGDVPPELWNKLGVKLVPKLRAGKTVNLRVQAIVEIQKSEKQSLTAEVKRALAELGIEQDWTIEET